MSLALSLNPCSGIDLSGDRFGVGEFTKQELVRNAAGNWWCKVLANQSTYHCNCFLKLQTGGLFDLAFSGAVYLDVYLWNGVSFVRGGYLEERSYTYTFGTVPIQFRALGVRPAAYSGGVKIEGLHTKDYWDGIYQGAAGTISVSITQPFVFSGRPQSLVNWRADNWCETDASAPPMSANLSGIIADDIRYDVEWESNARSASPARAASTPSGGSSFHPKEDR